MSKIDLHIHSQYSGDGELSPQQIVALGKAQGMELIAVTDHNCVRGVAQAQALGRAVGLRVVSGVELDCSCGGKLFHLLGYGFDPARPEFDRIEKDIMAQEQAAAVKKIELFEAATRILVDRQQVFAAAQNGMVTGELIAEAVLAGEGAQHHPLLRPYLPGGANSDMPHVRFYWDFFAEGKAAFVPIRYLSMAAAVQLLHSAGGVAVLAHPGQNLTDDTLLPELLAAGIDGIEAFSSYHTHETVLHYARIANENGLLTTCGSDFHGKHKPNILLGGHGAPMADAQIYEMLGAIPNKAR